jgi:transposase
MSYIKGESRDQGSLFPVTLDELVPANHLVRVVEAYVGRLDLVALGFAKAQVKATGRPPYDPADLLKLYLYGYLNQVRSSRRLERECARNVELMWLLNRLAPDFKTIADFRRENGEAFVAVCAGFVQFCRAQRLLGGELVAIDGSKFQGVASKRRAMTAKQLQKAKAKTAARVAEYLEMLNAADGAEANPGKLDEERAAVKAALAKLQDRARKLEEIEALMRERGVGQHVAGEEESRLMRSGQGRSMVAYNVQSAVDGEHGLIIHHEVTNEATDNRQLQPMSEAAKAVLDQDKLTVVADAGYSNGEQFEACEEADITPLVPLNRAMNNHGDGTLYGKEAFVYDAPSDSYRCPAGEVLTRKQIHRESRLVYYRTPACGACPLKAHCTEGKARTVTRHFHEDAFERMSERLAAHPDAMSARRSIVEHPFGGIKCHILGNGRLLLRHLKGARTEMALAVLAYNFRRVSNIMGERMLAALA